MKHMNTETRFMIENGLEQRKTFAEIARLTGMAASTISREVRGHRVVRRTGGMGRPFNACANRYTCTVTSLCEGCFSSKCKHCGKICNNLCRSFIPDPCPLPAAPPYVCNGCQKRGSCTLERYYYHAREAQKEYRDFWSESHTGMSYTEEEIRRIDGIVSPLVQKGQSLDHILETHGDELMISKSTLYRMLNSGILLARNIDLPRKVRFGIRKKRRPLKVDKRCRIGRTYAEYLDYMERNGNPAVVELDSVEGRQGGKVLLTVHFVKQELMLAFLRDANTSASVISVFDSLYRVLGHERFAALFPVCLTDNGSEFSDPVKLEFDPETGLRRTRVFYCDPSASFQKGSAERNHVLIRYVLKKGTPFDGMTQDDVNLLMGHINSYSRPGLGGRTPYDSFAFTYGTEVLDLLGVRRIPADDVMLKPDLMKNRGVQHESD